MCKNILTLFAVVASCAVILSGCAKDAESSKKTSSEIGYQYDHLTNVSYSDEGMLFSRGNILNFCGEDGLVTPICSDPSCKHKDESCAAYIDGGISGGIFRIDGKLYYFEKRSKEDFRKNFLVCSETDGTEKKTLGNFEGETIVHSVVKGDTILSSYMNSVITDSGDDNSDKQTVGVVLTDIKSGKSEKLFEKTDKHSSIDNLYYNGSDIYYTYTVVIDVEKQDMYTEICHYNCQSGEEEILKKLDKISTFGGITDKELLYTDFSTGKEVLYKYDYKNEPVQIDSAENGIASYCFIDGKIVYCGENQGEDSFYIYNGEKSEPIKTSVAVEELPMIYSVTDKYVYVGVSSNNSVCTARLTHEDFLNGKFDKTEILADLNAL